MMTFEEVVNETLALHAPHFGQEANAPSPLTDRLVKGFVAREDAKWLAGHGDIAMGMSYEMAGWGDAA